MMKKPSKNNGFTLMELMIAIAVLSILLSVGVGSYQSLFQKNELRGASESIYSMIAFAKSESIKSGKSLNVVFRSGNAGAWCAGLSSASVDCDCNAKEDEPNACSFVPAPGESQTKTLMGSDFSKVNLQLDDGSTVQAISFDPVRGFPAGTTTFRVSLSTASSETAAVSVNTVGSITIN